MTTTTTDGSGDGPRRSGESRDADELIRLLTENTNDLICLYDHAGRGVYANRAAERLHGQVPKTVSNLVADHTHPDDIAPFQAWWKEVLAGHAERLHWQCRDTAGQWRWLETTPALVQYHGQPHILTVCRDITPRKLAEQERQKQAEVLQKIFDNAPIGMNFFAADGRLLLVNRAWERIFGWTVQELQEEQRDIYVEATPDSNEQQRARDFVTEATGEWSDFRIRRRDGRVVVVAGTVVLLSDGTRIALSYDVTEQRHAEDALRAAEQRLHHVIASSPAVLFTLPVEDGQFRGINWMSENVETMLGYRVEETLGSGWWMGHVHPDDREQIVAQFLSHIFARDQVVFEYRFQHKDGRYRWMLGETRLRRDATGRPIEVVASLSDITERKRLEDQFRQAQKMEGVGRLAGGVAHDFNNLLGVILVQAELAEMVEGTPPSVREDLQQIRAAADRAANLTRQLLLFSSRQVMQPSEIDLNDQVTNLAKMLQRIIGADVCLKLHLHPQPLITRADAGMLDQVLLNLAVNARDAMLEGGRLLLETAAKNVDAAFAVLHPDAVPGRYVCLRVSDTGTGISPEVLPRIFEPFFTTKAPGKGTGLGLATAYGIVKQHRGWIQVYSEPGRGTTFQVFLPASEATAVAAHQATPLKPRGGTETILLVEDEAHLRLVTRAVLERAGYHVLEATNGVDALRLWQAHDGTVSLLLTDLIMPEGITGQQLARRLQEQAPQLRVVFASGYSPEIAGRELELRPGENFLPKPVSQDQLLETVRRCLDQS